MNAPHPGSDEVTLITDEIDAQIPEIMTINKKIHSNPELAYMEFKAHDAFVEMLQSLGFEVVPHAYGLETAFSCDVGSGGRLIIYNAEYDALPGVGHACGHNLIASSSFASFLGVAAALKQSGKPGRVRLLGTPAEEGGGGKLELIKNGAYEGADASLMVRHLQVIQRLSLLTVSRFILVPAIDYQARFKESHAFACWQTLRCRCFSRAKSLMRLWHHGTESTPLTQCASLIVPSVCFGNKSTQQNGFMV